MAAEAPTYNKMAVKVDGQSVQPAVAAKDDLEQRGLQRPVGDPMPKKRSTFKIMSITKNSPRSGSNDPLNDGDLDSLDELDESHTEEISSDILDSSKNTDGDQDTPSEDTTHNLTPDEIVTKEKSDIHSRFKVVKIETKEPFRRGRWMCYDFLDTPANFERGNEVLKFIDEVPSGNSSAASSVHFVYGVDDPSKNPVLPGNFPPMEGIHNIVVSSVHSSVHSQGTSDSFKPIQSQPPTQPSQSQSQGLYQTVPATRTDITVQGTVLPTVQSPGTQLTSGKHQSQISLPTPTVTTGLQQTQSSSQGIQSSQMNVSKTPSIVNQVSQLTPGVSNTQSQVVPVSKSVSHNQIPNTVQVSSQQPVLSLRDTSLAQPTKSLSSPVSRANVAQSSTGTPLVHVSAGDSLTQVVSVNNNTLTVQSAQQLHMSGGLPVVPQTSVGQINQTGSGGGGLSGQVPLTVGPERPMTTVHGHSQIENKLPEKLISQIGLENKNEHASLRPENIKLTEISESERLDTSIQAATLSLTPLTAAVSEMGASTRDDKEDSGSSTVAIDNKIEQAMDLVKSHLMFAVREEVEVLKEQIKELIEKNNQLEHENNVLKAAASQETLTKLSQQQSKPPASSS